MQCESREAGRARSGGGGNSFSPLTPFPCRRRSWCGSVIFGKICSSDLVQWLQSPSWRGGAQRRPLIYLIATGFLVGKKRKSRKIFNFCQHLFKKNSTGDIFPAKGGALPKRERIFRIFAIELFAGSLIIL